MKYIKLTQGKIAMVDDVDHVYLRKIKWQAHKDGNTFYARTTLQINGKSRTILMHRMIMKTPKGMLVDHQDFNGLNNQRRNLRNCTELQNQRNARKIKTNTSGYKGVSWDKAAKRWRVFIQVNRKGKHIGCFTNVIEAAKAYDQAALKYYGEFAYLNFPRSIAS